MIGDDSFFLIFYFPFWAFYSYLLFSFSCILLSVWKVKVVVSINSYVWDVEGRIFYVYKFRSMRIGADKQGLITVGGRDPRITRIGYFIRKYKLDELPQLFNVLKGDMSLVGPRPEVRKYVELYTEEQRRVLSVRPGITDYASIEYVDENTILGQAEDADKAYVEQILPDKICYNMKYIEHRSVKEYFNIIFLTIWSIVH